MSVCRLPFPIFQQLFALLCFDLCPLISLSCVSSLVLCSVCQLARALSGTHWRNVSCNLLLLLRYDCTAFANCSSSLMMCRARSLSFSIFFFLKQVFWRDCSFSRTSHVENEKNWRLCLTVVLEPVILSLPFLNEWGGFTLSAILPVVLSSLFLSTKWPYYMKHFALSLSSSPLIVSVEKLFLEFGSGLFTPQWRVPVCVS